MKTTKKIELNYDFTGKEKVEIDNAMAPLEISVSASEKVEIEAELSIPSFAPGTEIAGYFNVGEDGKTLKIELEEIPELAMPRSAGGRSQVWIRVPAGAAVIAESEIHPLAVIGLSGSLVIHNENGPIRMENCDGHIHLENENGPLQLVGCSGEFEIDMENGPVVAEKISGTKLGIKSENGPIRILQAAFPEVRISNENGMVYYETLAVESGIFGFENENGVVSLALPEDLGFELDAVTELGSVHCGLEAESSSKDGHRIYRRGDGAVRISVRTENGAIKINASGQSDLGFFKLKLEELKRLIQNAVGPEDKEKVLLAVENIAVVVEKALSKISEAKLRDGLAAALSKLKQAVQDFDTEQAKDKVILTVEDIGDELSSALKSILRKVRDPFREGETRGRDSRAHFHHSFGGRGFEFRHGSFDPEALKDYVHGIMESTLARVNKGLSGREKSEVDERSRIKILELLEAGKITAEEAERLLRAMGKE